MTPWFILYMSTPAYSMCRALISFEFSSLSPSPSPKFQSAKVQKRKLVVLHRTSYSPAFLFLPSFTTKRTVHSLTAVSGSVLWIYFFPSDLFSYDIYAIRHGGYTNMTRTSYT